jgi:hypothetical protein
MTPEQHASLLEHLSHELYLAGRHEGALHRCEEALAMRKALGHTEHMGHNLRRLSRLSWYLGNTDQADQHGLAAVALLETLPPGRELVRQHVKFAHGRGSECRDGALERTRH